MTEALQKGWREALAALDCQRPVINGEAAGQWPAPLLADLIRAGVLAEIAPARSLACPGCVEAPFCEVLRRERRGGERRVLLACPHCGPVEVPLDDLRRWQVEQGAVQDLVCHSLHLAGQRREPAKERLRRLGRLHRGGSPCSVWFGLHLFRRDAGQIVSRASLPARALLIVPGRRPSCSLPGGVISVSLRDVTDWAGGTLQWDAERLDELLEVPATEFRAARKPAPTRRQSRAGDIDALVAELKQHLRSARDYAYQTRETRGVPALLPRPSQKDLARRLGITESRLSRSLHDERATELRLLWRVADDLEQVLRFVS